MISNCVIRVGISCGLLLAIYPIVAMQVEVDRRDWKSMEIRRIEIRSELIKRQKQLNSLLLKAIKDMDEITINKWIKEGADLNGEYKAGHTPLHEAARLQSLSILQILLEQGANPNVVDRDGNTPLHLIAGSSTESILLSSEHEDSACRTKLIQLLLNYGANIHAQNQDGKRPFDLLNDVDREIFEAQEEQGFAVINSDH